jgi:hypothetical protein
VSDDGGVDEHEQRFGDEGTESRDRKRDNLPVDGGRNLSSR